MHTQIQRLTPQVTQGGANAITTHTIANSDAERAVHFCELDITFTGGIPAAAMQVDISDGTTTYSVYCPAAGLSRSFAHPVGFALGVPVTVTVPAAGVGISAKVSAGHYISKI